MQHFHVFLLFSGIKLKIHEKKARIDSQIDMKIALEGRKNAQKGIFTKISLKFDSSILGWHATGK